MIASLAWLLSPASAATWTVCADACDHDTLGAAVASAADGDEILVGDGLYDESLVLEDRTLTFTAETDAVPVVRGDGVDGPFTVRGGVLTMTGLALLPRAGRALTVDGGAEVTLRNASLGGGDAQLEGGVVRVEGASLRIEGSFLTDGLAVASGGLIHAADADLYLSETLLEGGNSRNGGAVAVFGASTVDLETTRVAGGLAEIGGGLYVGGGTVRVAESELTRNWASARGGAAAVIGGTLRVSATWVRQNATSGRGGGVHVADGGTSQLEQALLVENTSSDSGGAVDVAAGGYALINRSQLHGNSAEFGGGAVQSLGVLDSYQSSYCQNEAAWGGAITADGGDGARLTSYNDIYNENVANHGGALLVGVTGLVSQATFVGNKANDEAAAVSAWSALALTRSIVAHHPAPPHGSSKPSIQAASATFAENLFWQEANGVPANDPAADVGDPHIRFEAGGNCDDYLWPGFHGAAVRHGAPGEGDPIDYDGTLADLGATGGVHVDPAPWFADGDSDGAPQIYDCDDANPAVHPDVEEVWYDGIDGDCDRASDFDQDRDGYDSADHGGDDCDDVDPAVHPGALEIVGNDADENCDGIVVYDADGDGYSPSAGDCDDDDPLVNPGVNDRDPTVDQDCDGYTDVWQPLRPAACSTSLAGGGSALWLLAFAAAALRRRQE